MKKKPVMLMILDGWGIAPPSPTNAVTRARTPHLDFYFNRYPHSQLQCSGEAVGLPDGQMGNSEVGHLSIGSGRIIYQSLTRITRAVKDGSLETNPVLVKAMEEARDNGKKLHLLGLLSDGGVHSHIDHLLGLLAMARKQGVEKVCVHAFLDGRDTPPQSAAPFLDQVEKACQQLVVGRIATVSGRYYAMDREHPNYIIDRAIALHKMIRLVTIGAGGDGYLNFMGNEFGHPEWIDFPREGNGWSYSHARRQWSLADDAALKFLYLGDFDKAMIRLTRQFRVLEGGIARCLMQHEQDQLLIFERMGCVFVFNFHPDRVQNPLFVPLPEKCDYRVILSTDSSEFGGFENIDTSIIYHSWAHDDQYGDGTLMYLPPRTAVVLRPCTPYGVLR